MNQTIIIDVNLSAEDATEKAKQLAKSIQAIKDEQKDLKKYGQESSAAYAQNAQQLRVLNAEQKAYLQLSQSGIGSNNQLRAQLAILTQQYNALSKAERDNVQVGGTLQKQIRAISDELKVNEGAVGDNRRNVGNYKDALGSVKTELLQINPAINQASQQLSAVGGLFKNAETGALSFGRALLATGIGAFIALAAILINYLRTFDPLLDKIEQGFAAFKSSLDVVGRTVTQFFQNITSLGDGLSKIRNILLNPIYSFKQLGGAIKEAASAAIELTKAQQDLEDLQKIQEVSNAKAIQQIDQLNLRARNRTLSEKERQAALKQASLIDRQNFEQRTKLADEELKLAQKEIAIRAGLNKREIEELKRRGLEYVFDLKNRTNVSDADVDRLQRAEIAKTEILRESTNRQEKIQTRSDQIADQAAKQREARQAKEAKANEELQKAEAARIESLNNTNAFLLTAREKELADINNDFAAKIEQYKKYNATTEQLIIERDAKIKALNERFHKEDLEIIQKNLKEIQEFQLQLGLAQTQDYVNKELEIRREAIEAERQLEIARQDVIQGGVDFLGGILGKQNVLYKAAFLAQKAYAINSIVVQTQQALAANRLAEQTANASLSAIPIIGLALAAANSSKAAIQRAVIIAQGIASGAAVAATAVSGFSEGGVFQSDGKGAVLPGYAKKDNTNARLRSGEVVIVSEAGRDPRALAALSAINEAYGGRPLAPAYAMANGGIATNISDSLNANNATVNAIAQAVASMPRPIVDVRQIITEGQKFQNSVEVATI